MLPTFTELRQAGKIRFVGFSTHSAREMLPKIPELFRVVLVIYNHRMEKEAVRSYRDLAEACKPVRCASCQGHCESACPHGLSVRERLLRAHELLTI